MIVNACEVACRMDQRKKASQLNTDLTLIEYSKLAHQFILGKKNTLHPYSYHLPHIILLGLHCFYLF
jgi:hypothetical protein